MASLDPTTPIPTPADGAGSADLVTDSTDPDELRTLLERARERLSFYESFDKIIAENLRRTGEMMAETVALREEAAREARTRETADAAIEDVRERYRALLQGALDDARRVQPVIDALTTRLEAALEAITAGEQGAIPVEVAPAAQVAAEPAPERLTPDVPDVATPQPEPPPADEPGIVSDATMKEGASVIHAPDTKPRQPSPDEVSATIEILAHGVPSAALAIGLQQMLREIDAISRVEAREFADGELRLHLECTGDIPDESFTEWLAHNSGSLVSRNAKAIELSFT
jgi:hypothetical protein